MKRRSFLSSAALAAGAAGIGAMAAPAFAQGRRRLKMVTTWPKNFPGLGTSAERLAKRITEATEGALEVRVYADGELIPAFEAFDAVAQGQAEMYHGGEYYWQGKSTAFNFFASVPYGLTAQEHNAWIYHGGGQALWDELSAQFGIKPFLAANTGVQMGGWFNREIGGPDDFNGLRIRMPGLGGEVLRRLNAAVSAQSAREIYPALQSGAIDATEWVGPWNDLAFGFHKITRYYYYPGFHEPGTALSLGINLEVWQSFTPAQKAIVSAAAAAENDYTLAEFNAHNAAALSTLVNRHKVALRRFSNETLAAVGRKAVEVMNEVAASDPFTGRVFESFTAARQNGMAWDAIADAAYWDARRLVYSDA